MVTDVDLRGWKYTGRNIGEELHRHFRIMIDCLSQPSFVKNHAWGSAIQDDLAKKMKMSSSGAVRTVKKICENFGFINYGAVNSKLEIDCKNILTPRGQIVYEVAILEHEINKSDLLGATAKEKALTEVKTLYEEAYCESLMYYYFNNEDGTYLSPLRATLKALQKYERMDKWEWYLMNTFICHDDSKEEEKILDEHIHAYRKGALNLSMSNVIKNPKGHQYTPQHFEFAGLLHVTKRPEWSISDSMKHQDIKEKVLRNDFISLLRKGDT